MPRQLQTPPYSKRGSKHQFAAPPPATQGPTGFASHVLARRSRAEYRAARFPAPGRRSARRLRWFGCLVVCRTEPPRRPAEKKARCTVVRIVVAGRTCHVGSCATAVGRCEGEPGCLGGSDHRRDWLSTHSAVEGPTQSRQSRQSRALDVKWPWDFGQNRWQRSKIWSRTSQIIAQISGKIPQTSGQIPHIGGQIPHTGKSQEGDRMATYPPGR